MARGGGAGAAGGALALAAGRAAGGALARASQRVLAREPGPDLTGGGEGGGGGQAGLHLRARPALLQLLGGKGQSEVQVQLKENISQNTFLKE